MEKGPGKTGTTRWTFLGADQNRAQYGEFDSAAHAGLEQVGLKIIPVFRSSLVRDGRLDELYDADPELMRKLADVCAGIVVAKIAVQNGPQTSEQDIQTVEVSMEVRVIPLHDGMVTKAFSILERGAGFSKNEATMNARQRAADSFQKQLIKALQ